jgi:uncharacterized protein (TIGR00725 family)
MEPSGTPAAGTMPARMHSGHEAERVRQVAVIGPGRCSDEEYREAVEVGRLVAARGAVLVCGGLGGVMEAAARGAREAGGHTVGILPGHDRRAANVFVDLAVTTGLGEARNVVVVSAGDAVVAVGGGYGTLSEIGLAAKIGRPVVILHGWQIEPSSVAGTDGADCAHDASGALIHRAASPEEAVALAFALMEPLPLTSA